MVLAWLLGTQSRPGRHPGDRPRLWRGGPARPAIAVVPLAGGVRWYAVALLTVPLLMTAILAALSLTSRPFSPPPSQRRTPAKLLAGYLVVGLVISFFEEIGWTGFATHELRKRHGLLATGLILGLRGA